MQCIENIRKSVKWQNKYNYEQLPHAGGGREFGRILLSMHKDCFFVCAPVGAPQIHMSAIKAGTFEKFSMFTPRERERENDNVNHKHIRQPTIHTKKVTCPCC